MQKFIAGVHLKDRDFIKLLPDTRTFIEVKISGKKQEIWNSELNL